MPQIGSHTRRRLGAAAIVCGVALGCAATVPESALSESALSAKAREARICHGHAKGGHERYVRCVTLEANARVRVFYRRRGKYAVGPRYARWLGSSRVTALADPDRLGKVSTCRPCLAGDYVAYPLVEGPPGPGEVEEFVVRLNVRTGSRTVIGADGPGGKLYRAENSGPLPKATDMAVTPAGTVAWIIEGSYRNPSGGEETLPEGSKTVFELPAGANTPIVLATRSEIEPKSLAISSGYIYWSEAGAARAVSAR